MDVGSASEQLTDINKPGEGKMGEVCGAPSGSRLCQGGPEKCSLKLWWLNHLSTSLFFPFILSAIVSVLLPLAPWLTGCRALLQKQRSCFCLEALARAIPCACWVCPQITERLALSLHPDFCSAVSHLPRQPFPDHLSVSFCFLWFTFFSAQMAYHSLLIYMLTVYAPS